MKIFNIPVGPLETNCYVVSSERNNAVIIDPGFEAEKILAYCKKENLNIKKILLTHGHFDHIMGIPEIIKHTGVKVYLYEAERNCLIDENENRLSEFKRYGIIFSEFVPITDYVLLKDGDTVTLDELEFKLIATPGHSNGSCCFIIENEKVMFSGDTLFKGSIGNTNPPYGSMTKMQKSLKILKAINVEYTVYPGHGFKTSLQKEKATNPYLRGI